MANHRRAAFSLPLLLAALCLTAWAKRPAEVIETTIEPEYLSIQPTGDIAS